MVWMPKMAIVVWDGSPEAMYNLAMVPENWEVIIYAIRPFKNRGVRRITDIVMHECEDCTYLDRLRDIIALVNANYTDPREVAIVLPIAWDDIDTFRRITRKYPQYYWLSFAKSRSKEDLGYRKFA